MPCSETERPRFTASSRSWMLWAWEPVKCWSRLPKAAGGTIRRSTETPLWVCARTPLSPGLPAAAISAWSARNSASVLALVGGGDQVDVLAGLGPAADRAGDLDPVGAGVLAQRGGELLGDRPHGREQQAPRPLSRLAQPLERGEHVLLGLRPEPFDVAELLVFGRLLQVLQRGDLQFVPEQARGFRPDPGDAGHFDQGRPGISPSASPRPGFRRSRAGRRSFPPGSCRRRGSRSRARRGPAPRPRPGFRGSPWPRSSRRGRGSGPRRRARRGPRVPRGRRRSRRWSPPQVNAPFSNLPVSSL